MAGVNGAKSSMSVVQTEITLGWKELPERTFTVQLGVFDGEPYKCIIGMDLLVPFKALINVEQEIICMLPPGNGQFMLKLQTKDNIKKSTQLAEFREWQRRN